MAHRAPPGSRTLAQGLEVLRLLTESDRPLTATAIADRLGVSVSTASRALGALTIAGYVRKPDYHSFAPAFGVLALAGNARRQFGAVLAPRQRLQELADATPGLTWHLGMLVDDQLVYPLRVSHGVEAAELQVGDWPLHRSSIALLILLGRGERAALAALRASRRRYGWDRPGPAVPVDEAACFSAAQALLHEGVLALSGWQADEIYSMATLVGTVFGHPIALAVSGHPSRCGIERARGLLNGARADIGSRLASVQP